MINEYTRRIYRAAREEGWRAKDISYLLQPPAVQIEFTHLGRSAFEYEGQTFEVECPYDCECLCLDDDAISCDDFQRMDHRLMIVSYTDPNTHVVHSATVGSVCVDALSAIQQLAEDRYIASLARDLAQEIIEGLKSCPLS